MNTIAHGQLRLAAKRRRALVRAFIAIEDSARALAADAGADDYDALFSTALLGPYARARMELLRGIRTEDRAIMAHARAALPSGMSAVMAGWVRVGLLLAAIPPGKQWTAAQFAEAAGKAGLSSTISRRVRRASAYYFSVAHENGDKSAAQSRVMLEWAARVHEEAAGKSRPYLLRTPKINPKRKKSLEHWRQVLQLRGSVNRERRRDARRAIRTLTDPAYAARRRAVLDAWRERKLIEGSIRRTPGKGARHVLATRAAE